MKYKEYNDQELISMIRESSEEAAEKRKARTRDSFNGKRCGNG